jgi:hypothetical protein
VLTLSGRGFPSRVCGSLVRSAGLKDLVVTRVQDYVTKAVSLARNKGQVEACRAALKKNRDRSVLFNMDLLIESIENLYREMCDDYRKGRLPVPDLRNLDHYLEAGISIDHEGQELLAVDDYEGLYRAALTRQHWARPIAPDDRLWSADDIEAAERALKSQQTGSRETTTVKAAQKKRAGGRR